MFLADVSLGGVEEAHGLRGRGGRGDHALAGRVRQVHRHPRRLVSRLKYTQKESGYCKEIRGSR